MNNVKRVAIVGTGKIGAAWAANFLAQGFDVMATDPGPDAETTLRSFVNRVWPHLQHLGLKEGASTRRLQFTTTIAEAVGHADFIQESVPERETLKDTVIADISRAAKPEVIIASSTSGIIPTRLQKHCHHPERFVVGHPFNPVHLIPLVEVVGGDQTTAETLQWAMDFYQHCGKTPLHCKTEIHGHIANRLQDAIQAEALQLIQEGFATTADIDTALSAGPGLRWALMGSVLTAHMASAGGLPDVLGGKFGNRYCSYAQGPELDNHMIDTMVLDMQQRVKGRCLDDIEKMRDEFLVGILKLRADIEARYGFDGCRYKTQPNTTEQQSNKELL